MWLTTWTEHGNAPKQHAETLARLTQLRPQARYASDDPAPRVGEVAKLYEVARAMVAEVAKLAAVEEQLPSTASS